MSRLPQPGSDRGTWGKILNEFLSEEHNSDGTHKVNSILGVPAHANYAAVSDPTNAKGFSWRQLTASDVGLSNANNTSDADKPISTAMQTALNAKIGLGGDIGGTTANPQLKRVAKVFNVKDYGAIGNGTADETAAVQSAVHDAEASGGLVYFPPGTYQVVLPKITSGNISIQGAGWKSKILCANSEMASNGRTIGLWVNGANNVIIKDLYLDGNFANIAKNGSYANSSPLWDNTVATYGPQSVKNYQYASSGVDTSTYLTYRVPVRITNSSNIVVENCLIMNSISSGVLVDATSVGGTKDVMVRNNRIAYTWDNGVYFHEGCAFVSAYGNHCSDTQYSGVVAIYCTDVTISNNQIRNSGPSASDSAGIEVCGATRYLIADNLVNNALFQGIEIKNTQETGMAGGDGKYIRNVNGAVVNNKVSYCRDPRYPSYFSSGIELFGCDNTFVSGNQLDYNDYGINVSATVDSATIQNNVVQSNRSVGVYVGNSADIYNVLIQANTIRLNSSDGIANNAPIRALGNTITNNAGQGISVGTPPSGVPYKTDTIENNYIADNGDNGVFANSGHGNIVIIRNNDFSNSDTLTLNDGVSTASTTFTSADASFMAADKGSSISIMGVGNTAGDATLHTTIASVTNSTTVELATATSLARNDLSFHLFRGRQIFYDGSMTTGNQSLTSSTANFTNADIGKTVTLYATDYPNPSVLFRGTITGVTDPTTAVLNASPANATNIIFTIQRGNVRQGRAVYFSGNTAVHYMGNRSWFMRTENWPLYNLTDGCQMYDNHDFGSATSNSDPTPSLTLPYSAVNYTSYPGAKDCFRSVDASGGALSVYLPNTSTIPAGHMYFVSKTDPSTNAVSIHGSGQNINGSPNAYDLTTQWKTAAFINTGSAWIGMGFA